MRRLARALDSKFSIGISSFSIELAEAKRFEPTTWTTFQDGDFRQTALGVGGPSHVEDLIRLLEQTTSVAYFVVNLKNGNDGWISSRLCLFTLLLQKERGVKCVVFVDTFQGISNHFLGIAIATNVQSALECNYPWREKAFLKARLYSARPYGKEPDSPEDDSEKHSENFDVNQQKLIYHYVKIIQKKSRLTQKRNENG